MSVFGQLSHYSYAGSECAAYASEPHVHSPYAVSRSSPYPHPQHLAGVSLGGHQGHLHYSTATGVGQHKVLAERYKTKLCRNYVETGACPYEYRCMFAHGEHEMRTTEMNLRDGLTTEDAIRHYKRIMQYKALEEMAGIAQPPDYESTLSHHSLLDDAQHTPSSEGPTTTFGSNDWVEGSRNSSIAFRLSTQPSFEQLSAAPPQLLHQNNPYAWRSFEELPETQEELEPLECSRGETEQECLCANCLYERARPMQPSRTGAGPYRSPAIARTIAEYSRRGSRPVVPEPVYLRAPSFDAVSYTEVQMP